MKNQNLILTDTQVSQKIRRIAFEIYENNFQEKEIVLAGIRENGYELAKLLHEELKKIAPSEITLIEVKVDKHAPTQSDISLDYPAKQLANKAIILIDDVMNTGKTMAYCLKPFLDIKVKKIETAVLVNRSHTSFPVSTKYTGYELATTMNDHVDVQLTKKNKQVYLR